MILRVFIFCISIMCVSVYGLSQASDRELVLLKESAIDRLFDSLMVLGVDVYQPLLYRFPMYDAQKSKLENIAQELKVEAFQTNVHQKFQKLYALHIEQIIIHTPASLRDVDMRIRKIAMKRKIDAYGPWEVAAAEPGRPLITEETFSQFVASRPDQVLYETALKLYGFKNYKQAEMAFGQCVARNFNADTAYYMIGLIALEQDKYRKGIEYLKHAIRVNPGYEAALRRLGLVFMENHYHEEALPYLTAASRLRPEDDELLYNLAMAQFHLELFNQAYDNCKRTLKLNKKNASAKYLLTMFKNEHVRKMRKQFPAR